MGYPWTDKLYDYDAITVAVEAWFGINAHQAEVQRIFPAIWYFSALQQL